MFKLDVRGIKDKEHAEQIVEAIYEKFSSEIDGVITFPMDDPDAESGEWHYNWDGDTLIICFLED